MRINTRRRRRVVHSQSFQSCVSAEQTCYLISHEIKPWRTSSSDKYNMKSLHALQLSLLSTYQREHPPKPRQVLNPLMHYSDSYTEICLGKTCSFLVWRKIKHNLLPLIRFTSQSHSKMPICPTTTNPQAHFKKIIRLWYFITENKSNSKTIKFKLWGVENPKIF